jgi:hypothetical protein
VIRELDALRRHILSPAVRREFAESQAAVEAWERAHPVGLAETLDWVDQVRDLFGEPEVDRSVWVGDDYRL